MSKRFLVLVAVAVVFANQRQAHAELIIDNFHTDTAQQLTNDGTVNPISSSVDGVKSSDGDISSQIIGGERDAVLTRTFGTGAPFPSEVKATMAGGLSMFSEDSQTDGVLRLTYDGRDNVNDGAGQSAGSDSDSDVLSFGLDTDGASLGNLSASGDAFILEDIMNESGSTDVVGRVTVYNSDGTSWATRTFLIELGLPDGTDGVIAFDTFSSTNGFTTTDFGSVGAIVFEFDLNTLPKTDFDIGRIVVAGAETGDGPLPTPEPASIALFSIGAFGLLGFTFMQRRKRQLAELVA